jgi:hypothetical protein
MAEAKSARTRGGSRPCESGRRCREAMHRNDLPRVYELRDLLPDPVPPEAYFSNFDESLTEWPVKKERFLTIEADLAGLDVDAWAFLKNELEPLLRARDPVRGWQALFDKLNQAKGYSYLKRIGCADLRFIPEVQNKKGRRTPDIEGIEHGRAVLCEVKTINISDDEVTRQLTGGVGSSMVRLSDLFIGKLRSTVDQAAKQMRVYNPDDRARRIAFVVINIDDRNHEYIDRCVPQLVEFRANYPAPGPEIVFCYKGPFGTEDQIDGG